MPDRIDHATEAQRLLHQWSREAMPVAQVHATLALAEQLRIGNLIALGYGGDEADCDQARADARAALVSWHAHEDPEMGGWPEIRPEIAAALGIGQSAHQIAETTAAAGATAQEFVSAALALASFPSDARVEAAARVIWRWYVGENLDGFDKHAYIYDREKAMGATLEALKAAWEVGE